MPNISHTNLTRPRILWDNVARRDGVTSTYSLSEVPGFERSNLIDWFDWSLFRPAPGVSSFVDYTLPDGATLDSWGVFLKILAQQFISVEISYNNGGGFLLLDAFEISSFDENPPLLYLRKFDEVSVNPGGVVRVLFQMNAGAEYDFRQVAFGQELRPPMGQHQGVRPTTLTFGVVRNNRVSVNGSVLGSDIKRLEKAQELMLDYIEPDYYRSDLEPFVAHMAGPGACFYQWAPDDYPDEVGFSVAESITPPENSTARGKMQLTMPLRSITA